MRRTTICLIAMFLAATAFEAERPPGTISSPSIQPGDSSATAAEGITFTNSAGSSYSVSQLADQLQSLRGAVEQALPVLMAFNQTFSNAANPSSGTGGAVGGILSGALDKLGKRNGETAGTSRNSTVWSNLLGGVQKVLSRNQTESTPLNPDTLKNLVALQSQLQPVATTLQGLQVGVSTNQALTPTGR